MKKMRGVFIEISKEISNNSLGQRISEIRKVYIKCDTPANCTYEDIRGEWIFQEGRRESNASIDCSNFTGSVAHTLKIRLDFPNIAFDSLGHRGFWTIVKDSSGNYTNECDKILPGWSHDVLGKNWACYNGHKVGVSSLVRSSPITAYPPKESLFSDSLVNQINRAQKSWKATMYSELQNTPLDALIRRAGGLVSRVFRPPVPAPIDFKVLKASFGLPTEFDWRNVSGTNYVSPVRNQGPCGSCYAFSSLAMLEARLRIMTNNTLQVQFSPQDVVSCSKYSQGCEGGFPYAIAGKYAQDFGVLPEECYPYEGSDGSCAPKKDCKRFYVAEYNYVGGLFGGCNEELMKLDLVKNGPLTVAFEVYPDFQLYSGGIYHHTGIGDKFNPFHLVNHGVLITGYGIDNKTGEKFWIVKNSWGTAWGENGYFRIRRGTNECNIESMAVSAIPIP
ncbi:Dipeptidyl peptidase 1 like protein [Argiope bruennichi]|uniref:Dipeptidyl peptidase 1 n=1 Tax=Argiope bruennichi TaxID=94029 RepID=A0A8T0FUZ4_ARGBR|nr:Dipeptidyl peptidase 1 like protein [Argiope bruennichi]